MNTNNKPHSEQSDHSEQIENSENADFSDSPWPRRIKSFVMRAGRTTGGQQKAIDELGPKFLLPYQSTPLDWKKTFADQKLDKDADESVSSSKIERPRILEIGFGMGETTAYIAGIRQSDDFVAIEVHEPGVGALLKRIGEQDLTNLRLIRHDAVEVVENMLPEASLDGVHIFFPDPWHKKRHNKRRLIQPNFVKLLASRMKLGGYMHLATDWQEYAQQMLEVLTGEPTLKNTSQIPETLEDGRVVPGYAQRPAYRPVTKFENRGLKLGHGVWDLVFIKN